MSDSKIVQETRRAEITSLQHLLYRLGIDGQCDAYACWHDFLNDLNDKLEELKKGI